LRQYVPERCKKVESPVKVVAASYREGQEVFAAHFSALLGGIPTKFDSLMKQERAAAENLVRDGECNVSQIPSYMEIVSRLCHTAPRRAPGEDVLGGELFRSVPEVLAKLIHAICLKAHLQFFFLFAPGADSILPTSVMLLGLLLVPIMLI